MPVLDASVLVGYLAGGEHSERAREQMAGDAALWTVHLADAEVGHVLRRAIRLGEMTASRAEAALDALAKMPLRRAAHRPLLGRAWKLRENVSFYDALYVALAERFSMPLVTFDARIAGAVGSRGAVEVITVPTS